ncbi:MAG: glycosyltransferase family 2 protein [Agathobacter sp.]|uniref:glycosyltransferase family 2 protein n=1 Tax=Agathobacter sp. TaxID=2021311 RepID=UPI00258A61D1|nr:glycosyltransferase family 2 protein [Agathobacter sp.]MCR5678132.1 glycosyltransferase family 2 protein [Agathobacter sp.]
MSNKQISVSIFCMAYNQENYIRETIEGFLMQKTNFEYEILIHEDASTDSTADILKYYESMYPDKIKVVYEEKNIYGTGVDYFYDILAPLAKGKYIALCEGDDAWIDEDKLQLQFDYMESHPDCSLVGHRCYLQYPPNWDRIRDNRSMGYRESGIVPYETIFEKWEIPTNSFFFRKETFMEMPKFFREAPTGDEPLEFYLANKGYIYFINRVMSVYNKMTADSWSVKFINSGFEKMARYYAGYIQLFESIDEYTGYTKHDFYDACIKERIRRAVIYIFFNTKSISDVRKMLNQLADVVPKRWKDYVLEQEKCFWFYNEEKANRIWQRANDKKIYVYGAGALATKFLFDVAPENMKVSGFIISDKKKNNGELEGIKISNLSEIEDTCRDEFIVVAVIDQWAEEIKKELQERGIKNVFWVYETVFNPLVADCIE